MIIMTFLNTKIFTKSTVACLFLAMSFSCAAENVSIKKVANVPADFIKGADISTLIDVEKHGGKFFDQNHKQQDAMVILKQNGFNYVRLRLWVDPKTRRASLTAAAITTWRPRWNWRSAPKRRASKSCSTSITAISGPIRENSSSRKAGRRWIIRS